MVKAQHLRGSCFIDYSWIYASGKLHAQMNLNYATATAPNRFLRNSCATLSAPFDIHVSSNFTPCNRFWLLYSLV